MDQGRAARRRVRQQHAVQVLRQLQRQERQPRRRARARRRVLGLRQLHRQRTASAAPRTSTACQTTTTSSRRSSRRSSTAIDDDDPTTDWNYGLRPVLHGRRAHRQQRRDLHRATAAPTGRVPPRRPRRRCEAITSWIDEQLHARAEAVRDRLLGRRRRLARQLPLPPQRHPRRREGLHARRLGPGVPVERLLGAAARRRSAAAWNVDSLGAPSCRPASRSTTWARSTPRSPTSSRNDRLATTYFRRDMDFSLYSYERFYNFPPKDEILRMWDADTAAARRALRHARQPRLLHPVLAQRQRQPLHDGALVRGLGYRGAEPDARAVGQRLLDDKPIKSAIEDAGPPAKIRRLPRSSARRLRRAPRRRRTRRRARRAGQDGVRSGER